MSIIERDYLPKPKKAAFPPGLALKIVRKAASLAGEFEERAITQMTNDACRALAKGFTADEIATEMELS
jgi:hypothetical protein